jgi:hypothetical protein
MHRKRGEVPDELEGMRILTESKIEGQGKLHLNALIRIRASRCLLLMWGGRKFNPTRTSSYLRVDVLALLKKLV